MPLPCEEKSESMIAKTADVYSWWVMLPSPARGERRDYFKGVDKGFTSIQFRRQKSHYFKTKKS